MKIDSKIITIILLVIALVVVSWIAFQPAPVNYSEQLIKEEVSRLSKENIELTDKISERNVYISSIERKNDSLENLKPKIKIQYDTIYKKIDNSSAGAIANQFTNIFTNANVK
jgi:hypothetical protein